MSRAAKSIRKASFDPSSWVFGENKWQRIEGLSVLLEFGRKICNIRLKELSLMKDKQLNVSLWLKDKKF